MYAVADNFKTNFMLLIVIKIILYHAKIIIVDNTHKLNKVKAYFINFKELERFSNSFFAIK